jgi:hypothetical protein
VGAAGRKAQGREKLRFTFAIQGVGHTAVGGAGGLSATQAILFWRFTTTGEREAINGFVR